MALEYRLEDGVLRFRFSGATPARDVYTVFHRAYGDPACPPSAPILIDLAASTSLATRTPDMIKMLSEFVLEHPDRPGGRVAVALPQPQRQRFDELMAETARRAGVSVRTFDESESALRWLMQAEGEAS